MKAFRLTLFGRSALLIASEILVNAAFWIVAALLFGRDKATQPILSLALLAWTLGLRHALDADHISAIDNATRGLISMGQLPVTCGLFFSLGHSTIVVVVIVAIAISTDISNRLDGVGSVGGIIGAAVSGSFLFIVGLANSIILWRIIQHRRRVKEREQLIAQGQLPPEASELDDDPKHNQTLVLRIIGPIITFVDRPWKVLRVLDVSRGHNILGFDTASSIALLAVSAIAKNGSDGKPIPHSYIVILPLLFTAGMTLVDSADSILMLYSYSGFPERGWAILDKKGQSTDETVVGSSELAEDTLPQFVNTGDADRDDNYKGIKSPHVGTPHDDPRQASPTGASQLPSNSPDPRALVLKRNMMSGLSIVLTLMSIIVAFSISLITIMGLIGENCAACREAAEADDGHGGGLAGRWWRGWANANEQSGYIGAAIVGAFILVVCLWYGGRYAFKKRRIAL
ncbi:hypothetical protein ONZ45_g11627 [Pleurotus djamor]|nr:hypothetical protein ONZ45_g11627 [Pleurotus djamor]